MCVTGGLCYVCVCPELTAESLGQAEGRGAGAGARSGRSGDWGQCPRQGCASFSDLDTRVQRETGPQETPTNI